MECSSSFSDGSLIGSILQQCGKNLSALAAEHTNYEFLLENDVLNKINQVLENDIPSIERLKKKLERAGLDMDSCKNRLTALQSEKKRPETSKIDAAQEELDQASIKFHNCKDLLIIEMLDFMARETDLSTVFFKILLAEYNYHKTSMFILNDIVPEMSKNIEESVYQAIYGMSLEQQLKIFKRDISFVLEDCIQFLLNYGLNVEGLFRITGGAIRIRKLKKSFDVGIVNFNDYINDIHSVSSALKLFFRELPEPLLTHHLHKEWIRVSSIDNKTNKLNECLSLIKRLPDVNLNHLRYLICFLHKVSLNFEQNKMNSSNLATCIGPNLLWTSDDLSAVVNANAATVICELMIDNYTFLFGAEVNFNKEEPPSKSDDSGVNENLRYV